MGRRVKLVEVGGDLSAVVVALGSVGVLWGMGWQVEHKKRGFDNL